MFNKRTDALKTDNNLFFTITNCQIVHARSLTCRINSKFMCLSAYWQYKLANERAGIAAVIVKFLISFRQQKKKKKKKNSSESNQPEPGNKNKREKKANVGNKHQEPIAKGKKLKEKEQVQCFHHFTYVLINYSNLIPHSHIHVSWNMF